MPHINHRDEKMVRRLRLTRHMPTKEIAPKGGKGTYNRSSAKAEVDELLNEFEEQQREFEESRQFGGDTGIDADYYENA